MPALSFEIMHNNVSLNRNAVSGETLTKMDETIEKNGQIENRPSEAA